MPQLKTTVEKVREALLENGLLILFRIKKHKLDYSIMNRPEPELSGVTDSSLATAMVHAGNIFEFKRVARSGPFEREKVTRHDGRTVSYRDHIDIDWNTGVIETSANHDTTRQVLAAVIESLMQEAQQAEARKGGLN